MLLLPGRAETVALDQLIDLGAAHRAQVIGYLGRDAQQVGFHDQHGLRQGVEIG
ncbi:hypothetical protein D3C85_1889500 [compost metagenome]